MRKEGKMRLSLTLVLAAMLILFCWSSEPESESKADAEFFLNLPPHKKRILGLNLSEDLTVRSFEKVGGKKPWIEREGGVREGDRIVKIDGVSVAGKGFKVG